MRAVGPRRHLVDDVGEAEVGVDLLQQRRVGHALVEDLVLGAEDVAVVLREAAHAHDAVQRRRVGSLRWHWPNSP